MSRSVILRGPMPTPEQMADALGVSQTHLANLREVLEKDGFLHAKRVIQQSAAMSDAINEKRSIKPKSASTLMFEMALDRQTKTRRMSKKEIMQGSAATGEKRFVKSPFLEVHGQEKIAPKQKSRDQKAD